jgi:uncharacterized protein (TIGR02448 family)
LGSCRSIECALGAELPEGVVSSPWARCDNAAADLHVIRENARMIRLTLISILLACAIVAPAFAGQSSAGTLAIGVGTSASFKTTSPDMKVVAQARDDAASFVASNGRIRGAQLEAALRLLREKNADARRATDMQLAQAILAL